jgi:hypothetical protein
MRANFKTLTPKVEAGVKKQLEVLENMSEQASF